MTWRYEMQRRRQRPCSIEFWQPPRRLAHKRSIALTALSGPRHLCQYPPAGAAPVLLRFGHPCAHAFRIHIHCRHRAELLLLRNCLWHLLGPRAAAAGFEKGINRETEAVLSMRPID